MKGSVLTLLELIETGDVRWSIRFRNVPQFYTRPDGVREVYHPEVGYLTGRLYEREGFESEDQGRVLLTEEGRRTLRELRGDLEPRSVWSTS